MHELTSCAWSAMGSACLVRQPRSEFPSERDHSGRNGPRAGPCMPKSIQDDQVKSNRQLPTVALGQAANRPRVSIQKIKALSSNAATAVARYHHRDVSEDYEVLPKKVLGEGCSGKVVVARSRVNGQKFALKSIKKKSVAPKMLQQLIAEAEISLTLDHPNVARLSDVYDTDQEIALLTECLEGGELYARLAELQIFPEHLAAHTTRQMLRAIGYLHAHNVVHRDLKLENFLYESRDANAPLKVIDFGFAKVWDPTKPMQASCGSIAYVSPDVLNGLGYSSKCDLWSLGVITFMLLSGYPPFHGSDNSMRSSILAADVDWRHTRRWAKVSKTAIDFVKGLLVKDANKRLDAQTALTHRWLAVQTSTVAKPVLGAAALRSISSYADAPVLRRAVLQLAARELVPADVADLRQTFLDIAGDEEGTVTFQELKQAIRGDEPMQQNDADPKTPARRLRRAKTEHLRELFQVMDVNKDEQIYYSDFVAATMSEKLREEHLRAAFYRLDSDHSGGISTEDLENVIGDTFEGQQTRLLVKDVGFSASVQGEVCFDSFVRALDM